MSSPWKEVNPRTNKPYSAHCQAVRDAARKLPVSQQIDHIRNTVKENAVTIVVGETGSGKTTQVPQALLEILEDGMSIAVTQNRRLAAEMVRHSMRYNYRKVSPANNMLGCEANGRRAR